MVVDSYINNPRFLTRAWLASEVEKCLQGINRHFLLITGEPGIGKSGLIAQLAHSHPNWLTYFIRRDQRTPLGDVDAKSFLLHIGYQLAALYPKLFEPEAVKVVVEQRIGTVDESGEVVAIEVKKMLASPFHRKVVQIRQQIERNKGNVTGLRIGELIIDPRLLSLDNLQNMALFNPAKVMLDKYPNEKIVILVDALDELRYHNINHTLLDWLTNCPQLPSNVHFVLTSRPPDDALRTFCERQELHLQEFIIGSEDARMQTDLQTYVEQIVAEKDIVSILEETEQGIEGFTMNAVAKADGNIGYLDALARGIDHALYGKDIKALRELLTLQELPDHIEELYSFFLRQIKAAVDKQCVKVEDLKSVNIYDNPAWPAVYKPILSVLAVALEPLTLSQISTLGGIKADWDYFIEAMNKLSQFLEIIDNHYRLYHETVSAFLTNNRIKESPRDAAFYVDPTDARSRIVSYYRGKASAWNEVDWSQVDDYGLRNISTHLHELRDTKSYQYELYGLICESFMRKKKQRFFWHHSSVRDIRLALEVAGAEQPPNLVQEVRCCLLLSILHSRSTHVSPELLGVLAQVGEHERALSLAAFIIDARQQCAAYLLIAEALLDLKKKDQARNVLDQAVSATKGIWQDPVKKARRRREGSAWSRGMDDNAFDVMEAARPKLEKEWSRADTLSGIAKALVRAGEPNRAVEVLNIIEKRDREKTLSSITETLAREGQFNLALEIANGIEDDWYKSIAMANIASAMFNSEKLEPALEMAENIESQWRQACVLTDFAGGLIAEGMFDKALIIAKKIRNKDDPDIEEMLVGLVKSLAYKGQFDRALDLAETIKNEHSERAKASVACALAQAGEIDWATNLIEQIQLPDSLIFSLCDLAKALAQTGRRRKAKMIAERALSLIDEVTREGDRPVALCRVAEAFVHSGDSVSAEATAKEALEAAQDIPVWWARVGHWEYIAETLINVVEFEKSIDMVMELFENHDKVYILCRLTEELSRAGMREKAALTAKKAFAIAGNPGEIELSVKAWASAAESDEIIAAIEEIEDLQEKASALTALAQALAQAGEHIQASKVVDRAIEVSEKTNDNSSIDDLLCSFAVALARMKQSDRAMTVVDTLNDARVKSSTLREVEEALAQASVFDQALNVEVNIEELLDKVRILNKIKEPLYRDIALQDVAKALSDAGQIDPALAVTEMIHEDDNIKTNTLVYLAHNLNKNGARDRTREILQYAAQIKEDHWVRKPEFEDTLDMTSPAERIMLYQMGHYDRILASTTIDKEKANILSNIAVALALIGEHEKVTKIARQALKITPKEVHCYCEFDAPYSVAEEWMAEHLTNLAKNLALAGELDMALEAKEIIKDEEDREKALIGIVHGLVDAEFFDLALNVAQTIKDAMHKTHALNYLTECFFRASKTEKALATWRTALYVAKDTGRPGMFQTLKSGILTIAELDRGQTLWDIYKGVLEIESWRDH